MFQDQSWISLKCNLDRSFVLSLSAYINMIQFLSGFWLPLHVTRQRVGLKYSPLPPPSITENFVSLSHRPNWIRLFSVSCSHILAQSFLLLSWPYLMQFSLLSFQPAEEEEEKKKKQQQKRKQTLWSVKDRAIVGVRLSSVGFRFESSLSAMECAYNSSPLECERRKGGEQHSWHIQKESLSDPQLTCVSYTHTSAYLCVCVCFSSGVALSLVTCLVSSSRSRRFPTCPCLLIIPFRLESAFHQHFHFHFSNFSIFA